MKRGEKGREKKGRKERMNELFSPFKNHYYLCVGIANVFLTVVILCMRVQKLCFVVFCTYIIPFAFAFLASFLFIKFIRVCML